jgi:hypothetical protein
VLAGILFTERERMLKAINKAGGWTVAAEDRENEWWSVRIDRA